MKLKINDIPGTFSIINHLSTINDDPFRTRALQLLYKLQPDIKFLSELKPEQFEILKEQEHEIDIPLLPAPEYFGEEHREILGMVCENLPEHKSEIAKLLKTNKQE